MTTKSILIEPRDPLIFRDGKPAGDGLSMKSLNWPAPSSVAGALRTNLGRGSGFDSATVARLKAIEHVGPFLAFRKEESREWDLAFPAPADAVLYERDGILPLRPRRGSQKAGCDIPSGLLPLFGARPEKAVTGPAFWTADATFKWLAGNVAGLTRKDLGLPQLERDIRIHVKIDRNKGTAEEGMLFTTEGLEFAMPDIAGSSLGFCALGICSCVRTSDGGWPKLESLSSIGGESRLAFWSEDGPALPEPPAPLAQVTRLRLQLVTPAAFDDGWKPGWLAGSKAESPAEFVDSRLNLVAAAVPRAIPHSGFDLTLKGRDRQRATRFLAPAGSVYFFEADAPFDARPLWLRSICDKAQDRLDGFGIVMCGGWEWK